MIETTRRGAIATVAGGAVALTGVAAAYAYEMPGPLDPSLAVAAEWVAARDNLSALMENMRRSDERQRRWQENVYRLIDAGQRLGELPPTTLAGAGAVLGIAIHTQEPSGLHILHHNLSRHMPMLDWLRNAHGAIVKIGAVS